MNAAIANRQLELTANALCRAVRRTLRLAEREDPTGTTGMWKAVEHRCTLLRQFLAAAGEFTKQLTTGAPEAETIETAAVEATAPAQQGTAARPGSSQPVRPVQAGQLSAPGTAPKQPQPGTPPLTPERQAEILGVPVPQLKHARDGR